jgi:hypothetical protein
MTDNLDPKAIETAMQYQAGDADYKRSVQYLLLHPDEIPVQDNGNLAGNASWAGLSTDPIKFAWKPWMANGFLSLLVSRSGDGKSLLALKLCGCYLLGDPWPDGSPALRWSRPGHRSCERPSGSSRGNRPSSRLETPGMSPRTGPAGP